MDDVQHRDGLTVARRWARAHLGDPDLADQLIAAYRNPDTAQHALEQELTDQ